MRSRRGDVSMSISGLSSGSSSVISSLLMKSLDKDSSGAASLEEFKSVGQSLPSGSIDQSDEALSSAFSSLDADSDGSLTESEIATGLAKFSQESATALLGEQEAGGPPPPPPGGQDEQSFFTQADSDGSGSVSLDEFTAAGPKSASTEKAEELFSSIDTDGDGELSQTEDEAFRSSQAAAGAPPPPPPGGAGGPGMTASSDDDDDDDDTGTSTTLAGQLSEYLAAQNSYSSSSVTSYLNDAVSSLFSASA
ncbi:hypothetical protein EYR15_12480 [Hansschlegelia quercus]|uniref:EF-hand domain-containing protein n=2 Tax=Hansschlegelia quercus TaxID=2528245 RepID=A0A4Q9GFI7_9HYPH|nr:hypothetical protein EYR15_12480 [Hansschlegelia quercus]